jgi:hypothetical protein
MDRFGAGLLRRLDDAVALEIAFTDRGGADMHRLVGHRDMQRIGVGVRIDRDGGDAHAARGANDPASDLAAIGDQDFVEHRRLLFPLHGDRG